MTDILYHDRGVRSAVPGDHRHGLRSHLVTLALVCLLPVILVSSLAVWKTGMWYKATATERLADKTRTMANAVEQEIRNRMTILTLLSQTSGVTPAGSDQQLGEGLDTIGLKGDINYVAAGSKGDGLPSDVAALARDALAGGVPVVSNITMRTPDAPPRLSVAVPDTRKSRHGGAFVLTVSPEQLILTLQQHGRSLPDILVAVTDGNGRIVARSRDPERYVGQRVPDWDKLQSMGAGSGLFTAVTTEGSRVFFSFQKLAGTPGWVVVVGEPANVFDASWRDPLLGLLAGIAAAILLAIAAAFWIGGRILRPLRDLVAHSKAIAGEGQAETHAPIPPSSISEFETLRLSFEQAEKTLRERVKTKRQMADMLAKSERRYRAIAEAGALVVWRRSVTDGFSLATGWGQLTGRPESEIADDSWTAAIHPDDSPITSLAWSEAVANGKPLDVEFRIKTQDDGWRWVRSRGAPVLDDKGEATEWVGVLEDVDLRRRDLARIAHMAHHDVLTGLGNRVLLQDRLEKALVRAARGELGALLCIDLDRFKPVNDNFGHAVGDAVLRAVADRLRSCVGDDDFVARTGGDEFAIVLVGSDDAQDAVELAERVVEAIDAPFEVEEHQISIGTSVGIVALGENHGPDHYLRCADVALYRAKANGRGRFCIFEAEEEKLPPQLHREEIAWNELRTTLMKTVASLAR